MNFSLATSQPAKHVAKVEHRFPSLKSFFPTSERLHDVAAINAASWLMLVCALAGAGFLRAEEAVVFECEPKVYVIPRYSIDPGVEGGDGDVRLYAFHLGKQLGVIDTGTRTFESIFEEARHHEPSGAFFADGRSYLVKSAAGNYFALFFEYDPSISDGRGLGHRVAIGRLTDLGSKGTVFVGSPHESECTDEVLLRQLKQITRSLPKQKKP